jgi:hypothetical protein
MRCNNDITMIFMCEYQIFGTSTVDAHRPGTGHHKEPSHLDLKEVGISQGTSRRIQQNRIIVAQSNMIDVDMVFTQNLSGMWRKELWTHKCVRHRLDVCIWAWHWVLRHSGPEYPNLACLAVLGIRARHSGSILASPNNTSLGPSRMKRV